jgi:hypothetical protein
MIPTSRHYRSVLDRSQRVAWNLDDVLPEDTVLDFSRPFLPRALSGVDDGPELSGADRLALDHIRANGYLVTFGLVEEMILPFVLSRIEDRVDVDLDEVRALLQFADEEAKHIALFRRFERTFRDGFQQHCEVIGPASAVAEHILSHSELGVGLLILHIEWMTQRHYVELARGNRDIEPAFRRLLEMHWLEERQHARLDGFIVASLASEASNAERRQAVSDYVALLRWLDDALWNQVDFDLDALERARGDALPKGVRTRLRDAQHRSLQQTFITSGTTHPRVVDAVAGVHLAGRAALAEVSAAA